MNNILDEVKVLRASILGAQRQLEIATLRLEQIEASIEGAIRAINKRTGGNDEQPAQQSHACNPELFPMDWQEAGQEGLKRDRATAPSERRWAIQQDADIG
jgi:hypothetical protein